MPDVTLQLRESPDAAGSGRLERALERLGSVELVSVDSEKDLVAVSYTGGADELEEIGRAVEEAGYAYDTTPGADNVGA